MAWVSRVRGIEYHDLQFEKAPVTRYSARGVKYTTQIDIGMPTIPPILLNSVFYLYLTEEDARKGKNAGATGFIVGIRSKKYPKDLTHIYAVSNWHAAIRDGCSVIRLNTLDGGVDIIDHDPGLWTKHPEGYDIAVADLPLNLYIHKIGVILEESFATRNAIKEHEIGPGDGVFMLGRFIDFDGGQTNVPAARFGHISIMPMPMKQSSGANGECYCLDVHSRSGFSGSPAFVYRTPGTNFNKEKILDTSEFFMLLLGIHRAQFPEPWEINKKDIKKKAISETNINYEQLEVTGLSGMTSVCPAWQILELLNMPKFVKQREIEEKEYEQHIAENGNVAVDESASGMTRDKLLKNMLNTPPESHKEMKKK